MSDDIILKLGVDARDAKKGTDAYNAALQTTKTASKQAEQGAKSLSDSFKETGKQSRLAAIQQKNDFAELRRLVAKAREPLEEYRSAMERVGRMRALAGTKEEFQAVARAAAEAKAQLQGFETKARSTTGVISSFRNVMLGLGAAFVFKELVKTSSQMQDLEVRLRTLTGSAEKAAEAMGFIEQVANKQHVEVATVAEAYTKLTAAVDIGVLSMADMRKLLVLMNDNTKAYGVSANDTQLAFRGLSQVLSNGTVNMEDLRQITQNMPGLFDRLADAAGGTVPEFRKAIESGKMTSDMLVEILLPALEKNRGAAEKMGGTWSSTMTDISNEWSSLGKELSDNGWLDAFSTAVKTGISLLKEFSGWMVKTSHDKGSWLADRYNEFQDQSDANFDAYARRHPEEYKARTGRDYQYKESTAPSSASLAGIYDQLGLNKKQSTRDDAVKTYLESNESMKASTEARVKAEMAAEKKNQETILERIKAAKEAEDEKKKAAKDAAREAKRAAAEALSEQKRQLKDLQNEIKKTNTPLEKYAAEMKHIESLRGVAKTADEMRDLDEAAVIAKDNLMKVIDPIVKIEEAGGEMAQIFKDTATDIKNSLDDALEQFLDTGKVEDFGKSMVKVFKKSLAEMTVAAIAKPVIVPFIQSVGGALGMNSSALSGITNAFGGSSILTGSVGGQKTSIDTNNIRMGQSGSVTDLPWMAATSSGLLFNSGAAAGAAQFAANLGFGPGSAGLTTAANFGGVAGSFAGAGAGFAGNFLANSIFGNDRGIGAPIGGAIGGVAGGLLAASPLLGLGPIGIAAMIGLGAFGGNFLGGLTGSRPAANQQTFDTDLKTGNVEYNYKGSFQGKKFSQENKDAAESVSQFAAAIAQMAGGLDETLRVKIGRPGGGKPQAYYAQFGDDAANDKAYKSVNDLLESVSEAIVDKTGKVSEEVKKAIKEKIDFSDLDQAQKDLTFAFNFDRLKLVTPTVTALKQQMISLEENYKEAVKTAQRLGLAESTINEVRKKELKNITDTFNKGIKTQQTAITNPGVLVIQQLEEEFAALRNDAITTGGDLVEVERLYGLKRAQVLAQINNGILEAGKASLDEVTRIKNAIKLDGSIGGLSREEQYKEALRQRNQAQADFKAGKVDVNTVDAATRTFLSASKDFYGLRSDYYKDQAESLAYFDSIAVDTSAFKDTNGQILDQAKTQTELLAEIKAALTESDQASTYSKQVNSLISAKDSRLLRQGETFDSLVGVTNEKNGLDELLVRAAKVVSGFDFSKSNNQNRSYMDWVNKSPVGAAGLDIFNSIIESFNGTTQKRATGGNASPGWLMAGENGPELINLTNNARVYNSGETQGMLSGSNGLAQAINNLVAAVSQSIAMDGRAAGQSLELLNNISTGITKLTDEVRFQ